MGHTPLLLTKLRPMRPRPNSVSRPRLLSRLDAGASGLVTLVCAPAGFGKSTLLARWINEGALLTAYLSLDEGDNDPAIFWTYLVSSLRIALPDVGERALELLENHHTPPLDVVLADVINGLSHHDTHVALVIDDYHVIDSGGIHSGLIFLIDHAPPCLHLVIASRSEPPLPLARWRARGELFEITAADLRSSEEEAGSFLRDVMRLDLAHQDVASLADRTEGWWAGLQLAALSLKEGGDARRVIDALSGDNRLILDYFTEEVLERQTGRVKRFLLETSILEHLCAPLCERLTQRPDSQEMLEWLDRSNLFVEALDGNRHWYRYHALFADLLRRRLTALDAEAVPHLHARAGLWHEQEGHIAAAIRHYRAANEIGPASRLISRTISAGHTALGTRELLGWFEGLAGESPQSFPRLSLAKAVVTFLSEHPEVIEAFVRSAGSGVERSGAPDLRDENVGPEELLEDGTRASGGAEEVWVAIARVNAYLANGAEVGLQLNQVSKDGAWLLGTIALSLGSGYYYRGDWDTASKAFSEAHGLLGMAGYGYGQLVALLTLGDIDRLQGSLGQAADRYREMLEVSAGGGGQPLPLAGHGNIGLAKVWCERYELVSAKNAALEGLELGGHEERSVLLNGHLTLSLILRCQGDFDGALRSLEQVEEIAHQNGLAHVVKRADAFRAQLLLAHGHLDAVSQWFGRCELSPSDEPSRMSHGEYVTLALVLLAFDRTSEASELLRRLRQLAEKQGRLAHRLEVMVVQALALREQRQYDEASAMCSAAMRLGAPEGFVRPFLLHGDGVHELLDGVSVEPDLEHYRTRLRDAAVQGSRAPAPRASAGRTTRWLSGHVPIEPLSEREMTVLRLLVGGMSNKEIAKETFVSVNTVKTHVRSIYGKLGVGSRARLVARVNELDLLG